MRLDFFGKCIAAVNDDDVQQILPRS